MNNYLNYSGFKVKQVLFNSVCVAFLLFISVGMAFGQSFTVRDVENVHAHCGTCYVSNQDQVLGEEAVRKLNVMLRHIEDSTKAQVVVVALETSYRQDSRDFSMELYDLWKPGRKGIDDGLIILLIVDSRQVFLRTGYGLEGILPDARCTQIFQTYMAPEFKKGNWDAGMIAGVEAVSDILLGNIPVEESESSDVGSFVETFFLYWFVFAFLFLVAAIWRLFICKSVGVGREEVYRRFSSRSSKWLKVGILFPLTLLILYPMVVGRKRKIRRKKIICEHCHVPMHRLNEREDDAYLNAAQLMEEVVKSKDYDVWLCPKYSHTEVYGYNLFMTSYKECPQCHNRTLHKEGTEIVRMATPRREGLERTTYRCKFCDHVKVVNTILPVVVVAAGSVHSRGGGFGGFGGGGGGFGGGMSGGGGGGGSF